MQSVRSQCCVAKTHCNRKEKVIEACLVGQNRRFGLDIINYP